MMHRKGLLHLNENQLQRPQKNNYWSCMTDDENTLKFFKVRVHLKFTRVSYLKDESICMVLEDVIGQ